MTMETSNNRCALFATPMKPTAKRAQVEGSGTGHHFDGLWLRTVIASAGWGSQKRFYLAKLFRWNVS